jgi:rhamnosyltransferase
MSTAVVIPTYNAAAHLPALLSALSQQTLQPDAVLFIDSQSKDGTANICRQWGGEVKVISQQSFNHGGTRKLAADWLPDADVLIYMTQDAIPANEHALANLRDALFVESDIGCAYGRQIPHADASVLARHARTFNYPSQSITKRLQDSERLGIKTCFSSDSFAAYRREALTQINGFPEKIIGSEDAYVAGKMLLAGWGVRYVANAVVRHSHNYTLTQEFKRYFDIGVFYGRETWLSASFGGANSEGWRFVKAEMNAVREANQFWRIPEVCLRTLFKWLGYKLGHCERFLPRQVKSRIGMFPNFWQS